MIRHDGDSDQVRLGLAAQVLVSCQFLVPASTRHLGSALIGANITQGITRPLVSIKSLVNLPFGWLYHLVTFYLCLKYMFTFICYHNRTATGKRPMAHT